MNHNNPLQSNFDDNTGFNGYLQTPTNMVQTEQSGRSDYSSAVGDNITSTFYATSNYEQPQQPMFSFLNNDSTLSYALQYTDQNISPPFNPINTIISNSSQTEVFRFEIPGFKIIIVPTSSPLANLDMQSQQDTYLNSTTSLVSQSQLNQEQSYVSRVNGTTSGNSIHYQQQNFNESFNNFRNLRD
jgi:hypothetical protein